MSTSRIRVTLLLLAVGLSLATGRPVLAQAQGQGQPARRYRAPRTADGKPNLNGIWQALNTANWDIQDHSARPGPIPSLGAVFAVPAGQGVVDGHDIPYQPWAVEKKKQNAANWLAEDPEVKCYSPGVPRATYLPYPFQIVQTPSHVLVAYEFATAVRTIYMGKTEEESFESWMGQSVGRWEGDTLVVEVTNQTDRTWFDRAGNFHSDAMKVTERYTPTGPDTLLYEATIEDPKVFTRPWTMRMPLYRRLDANVELLEYKCVEFAEELLYGHLKKADK